jgi:hypothetical protein
MIRPAHRRGMPMTITIHCACGRPFIFTRHSRGADEKYCSGACRREAKRVQNRAASARFRARAAEAQP